MKSRIILINPRLRAWSPSVLVPLGLTYIAAVLELDGNNVSIIDMNAEKVSGKRLKEIIKNCDVVGITGMVTEFQQVLKLSTFAREANSHSKIILGGPLATTFPRELLQLSPADFAVIGEGERTILELASAIKNSSNVTEIRGIGYKDSGKVIINECTDQIADIDTIPPPARHLLNMNHYVQNQFHDFDSNIKHSVKIKSSTMITSRGCPYNCTFCYKEMWGNKWRARSPENIFEEMNNLHKTYGINGFIFNDDTFVMNPKRVFDFCDLLIAQGTKFIWLCNGRVNLMTKELCKAMYNAGCREIAYGIESGNQQMLDALKKNITIEQIRDAVKWTKDAGIRANGYFMIGLPGETKESIRQTIDFAEKLDLDFYGFSIATPLLGTELYQLASEKGLIKDNITSLKDWAFDTNTNLTADCTDEDIIAFKNEIFRKFTLKKFGKYYMFNPAFIKRVVKVMASIQSTSEFVDLTKRATGIIRSHWRKI